MKAATLFLCALALLAPAGCDGEREAPAQGTAPNPAAPAPAPVSNRIDVPETVRRNLGITFAKVERRPVASTLRVPGRFELLPTARREYRAPVAGSVRLLVSQYQRVEKGTPLFRMDSPEWHTLKRELHEAEAEIERAAAELAVAQHAKTEAEQVAEALQNRVQALAGAEVRRAELETELAARRASVPRLGAEIQVKEAALEEARHDLQLSIEKAASVLGLSADFLREVEKGDGGHETQRWYGIDHVEVVAAEAGVVESFGVTDGSWVEQAQLVVSTVNPQALRFRASALQADLARLRDGAAAAIIPPRGADADAIRGKVALGLEASADTRTVELIVTPDKLAPWARAGVSAVAEIVTAGSTEPELAIPVAAVVQDELNHVFFRRDPKDPDKVIRVEADLGVSDGRWVVVNSGVKEGDEVVLDGVYELKLTGSGKTGGGDGHFHADGTWHPAGTPEPN